MLKSPIDGLHEKLGAVIDPLDDRDGWDIPVHYGDVQAEYDAARTSAVRTDRSHRTKLRLVGEDSLKFLQNILTNDVAALQPGDGTYAALLTATGKMIADFRVAVLSDSILLDTEAVCRGTAFPELDKFNLGYDCEMEDISDQLGIVTLAGPQSPDAVHEALGDAPGRDSLYASIEIEWEGERAVAAATDRLGIPAIDVIVPIKALPSVWEAFGSVPPAGRAALDILRVEAGIPRFGDDMDDTVNPMEVGLMNALDFDKGCYVGQEVVAKIESLGHVNRHWVGLKVDADLSPGPGATLFKDGKKVGQVTSAVRSPRLGACLALGYVHRKASTPGTSLEAELSEARVPAVVVETPFTGNSGA